MVRPPPRRLALAGAVAAAAALAAGQAWSWGATGHRLIGQAAALALPSDVPAFLRTPAAVQQLGELDREPDRSKGGGKPHDADLDPGHFVDLTDDGHVFTAAGPSVDALPGDRLAFSEALTKADIPLFKAGWLPYSLMDGHQQLVRDFALWRTDAALAKNPKVPAAQRAWYAVDRALREQLTIRDLGWWGHFVGDASQPMHVSIHYNGWGREQPNPQGYTLDPVHGPFEGPFVSANVRLADVQAAMAAAPGPCAGTLQACTAAYLRATLATVEPFYRLWGAGAFTTVGDARGKGFAVERVAAGAAQLRDLTVRAWRESADAEVGYKPAYKVRDVENGLVIPFGVMRGDD